MKETFASTIKFGPDSFTINRQEISYSQEIIENSLLKSVSHEQLLLLLKHRLKFQQQLSYLLNQKSPAKHLYASLSATHLCFSSFYSALNRFLISNKIPLDCLMWKSTKSALYSLVLNSSEFIVIDEDSYATFNSSRKTQANIKKYTKQLELQFAENLIVTDNPLQIADQALAILVSLSPIMWSDFYELIISQEMDLNEEGFEHFISEQVCQINKNNYVVFILKDLLQVKSVRNINSFLKHLNLANLGVPSSRDGRPLKSIGVYLVPDQNTRNKLLERYPNNSFWDKWGGPHVTFSGFEENSAENRSIIVRFLKNIIEKRDDSPKNNESQAQTLLSMGQKVFPYINGGCKGLVITNIFDAHFRNLKKLGWSKNKRPWHLTLDYTSSHQLVTKELDLDKDLLLQASWLLVFVGGYEVNSELNHYAWGKVVAVSLVP